MSTKILFKGVKTPMDVHAWGFHKSMFVQPCVATTDWEMGILVWLFEEASPNKVVAARLWGLVTPHDLLTCWRGMLILQEVKNLEEGDLCNAYYAGQRNLHESDKYRIDEITAKIGRDKYDAIMAHPIPEEVVSLIIKLTDDGKHIALWPITEEVRAGTLQWREDFTRIGAKHPQEVDDREAAEKRVIRRYDSRLADYAKSHGYPRKCMIMWNIEGVIIDAVEKGIEAQHGPDVVLGTAIARAHGGMAAFAASIGFGDEDSIKHSISEGIREAVKWLTSQFKTGWLVKKPKRSCQEYECIMRQLDNDWENMPITHPLSVG